MKSTPNTSRKAKNTKKKTKQRPPSKAEQAAALLREEVTQQCLLLKKKGQSHREIAASLIEYYTTPDKESGLAIDPTFSITHMTVGNYLREALAELIEQTQQTAEEVRAVEAARLDWLLESIAGQVDAGCTKAVNAALRISESRRKLFGTDAPQKVAPVTPDGNNEYVGLGDTERTAKLMALIDAARARAGASAS